MLLDAIIEDGTNIKEYNEHTNLVGDTLYDVGLQAGDKVVDVASQVENTIEETELPEIDFLKFDE